MTARATRLTPPHRGNTDACRNCRPRLQPNEERARTVVAAMQSLLTPPGLLRKSEERFGGGAVAFFCPVMMIVNCAISHRLSLCPVTDAVPPCPSDGVARPRYRRRHCAAAHLAATSAARLRHGGSPRRLHVRGVLLLSAVAPAAAAASAAHPAAAAGGRPRQGARGLSAPPGPGPVSGPGASQVYCCDSQFNIGR